MNNLFPRFHSDGPYIAIRNQMAKELAENIKWHDNLGIAQPLLYQQMIVDFTIALVKISKLNEDWWNKNK